MRGMRSVALLLFACALAGPAAAASKVFNVVAHQFSYDITPSPFIVDQGDSVTINVTALDAGQGNGHGFFIQHYAEDLNQVRPGSPITVQFTAETAGTFLVFCTIICGIDHPSMSTELTVIASANQPPSITSFDPTSGTSRGGDAVTIIGTNFRSGATVDFGTMPAASVTFVSPTRLDVTTPAHAAGLVAIKVTNPDAMSATSEGGFEFLEGGLVITRITPANGSIGGGTLVTITGAGFAGGTGLTVTFGGAPSTKVQVVSDRTLTAVAPPHASGTVEVVVSASNGSAAATFDYQVAARRRSVRT